MAITNPVGRLVLRYTRNNVVQFQEINAADLRTAVEALIAQDVSEDSIFAFDAAVLEVVTRLVIKINDVEV